MTEQPLPGAGNGAYDSELRAGFLRVALLAAAAVLSIYLLQGMAGLFRPRFFPWDAVLGLGLTALCAGLYRRGEPQGISLAASWLVAGVNVLAAFYSQYYGVQHPVTALYLAGLVLSGMLIGGWFLRMWGAMGALFILLWAYFELQGATETAVDPITSWPDLWGVVLFWWLLLGVTGWLIENFAHSLERAAHISRAQTAALAQTVDTLASGVAFESFLHEVMAVIAQQLGAQQATLYLYEDDGDRLMARLSYQDGRVAEIADADAGAAPESPDALTVPLLQEGRARGSLRISRSEQRPFTPNEVALAQALAQQVTLAMQLTQLAEQQQQGAVIAERNRMAREIHDTLAQGFTGILIQLEAAEDLLTEEDGAAGRAAALEHLSRARRLGRDSLQEARRSVQALRPGALQGQELPAALREMVRQLAIASPAETTVTVAGAPHPLAPQQSAELLRIAQEALTNALKHSGATRIEVALSYQPQSLVLSVRDDGKGFDAGRASDGFGLTGMRERAALIGARLAFYSPTEGGTRVVCTVPLAGAGAAGVTTGGGA